MPVLIDQVFYELALHDEGFADSLRKAAANLDGLDSGAKKTGTSVGYMENAMRSATDGLKRFAENIAEAAILREFIKNTVDAQGALAQMQAALKSTGGAAGFTFDELVKMSDQMSKLSTFSSEAVQGGLSRLLTYTGIQGPMFKEAARATLDFAAALRIDTTSAAERVGNALQYPTEAINSLTRQGFRFTTEQKRMIQAFEETGQLAKAQAIILSELDLAYKGSAEAARNTLGGALVGLKNDFMSTLEVSKESSSGLIEAINSVADAMPALRDKFSAFFGGIGLLAVSASEKYQRFLNLFRNPTDRITDDQFAAIRAEAERKILGLGDDTSAGLPGGKRPAARPAGNHPLGLTDQQLQAQKNARAAFEAATAALTPDKSDNFDVMVDRLVAAAKKAKLGTTEIAKMVADLKAAQTGALAKEGRDLTKDLQSELAKATGLQADALKAALADFDDKIGTAIVKGVPVDFQLVAKLREAKEQAIPLAEAADRLRGILVEIDHNSAQGTGFIQSMRALNDELDSANADFGTAKAKKDVQGMEAAQSRINTILAKQKALQDQIAAIIALQADESATLVQKIAGGVAALANVAFGLSSAFAGANSELTKMLGSIGQAAGGVQSLMALANTKDANGNAPGLGGLLSSGSGLLQAAPAIGQIIGGALALGASIFGKSPEELRRIELQKQNNDALKTLTKRIGDLGLVNVTGTQLGQLQKFFASGIVANATNAGVLGADRVNRIIGAALDAVGLSAKEFKDIAAQFGITIDATAKITAADIKAVSDAIKASELTEFANTFTGQMSQFNAAVKVFDLKKPIDQFNALRTAIGHISGGGGALQTLLDGFDLTSSEGINKAIAALQDLFSQLQAGTLSAADLGGLTPEQFEQLIEQTIGIVRDQAANGGVAGTGGFNVDRTITEVTGSRLEALLSTDVIWNQQTAENTAALLALFGGGTAPLISAPSLPTAGGLAAHNGPLLSIDTLNVQVSGLSDPTAAQEVGARVGRSTIDEIERGLGQRLRIANLTQGRVS